MYPIHVLQCKYPWGPYFTPFHSTMIWSVFELQAILRKVHQMTPNWLEHYKLKCSPYVLIVSIIPKFHSVTLYDQPFLRYRAFWDKCTEWPQNDLEPYKFKCTPYIYTYCPRVSNFTQFCSTISLFQHTGHFETSAPNDPKMTLNPTRS